MNKLLGIVLRVLLLLLILNLLALGGYMLHTRLGWSLLEVGALYLGALAAVIAVLAGRRLYCRRREERFIRKMVEHDRPSLTDDDEDRRIAELRQRWTRGVAMLRASTARLGGDPLYSLPWFMIFGESGSGKSTAISHARLSASASEAGPLAHVANTRNCDWWFFDEAVILDTAGRYAVPIREEADRREWEEFLSLLAAHRRREPLNGLILTLSAERLQNESPDALGDYGRALRKRMDSMVRALGARFPVYVLITKMDKVLGLDALAGLMDEAELRQALGLLDRSAGDGAEEFLERALSHVRRRLSDLSLLFIAHARAGNAEAVLLPEELERLYPGIRAFVRGAFAPSVYAEAPRLRGLFFSSGRQEGQVRSNLLAELNTFKDVGRALPGTDNALFLHDFFTAILPRERGLGRIVDTWLNLLGFRRNLRCAVWLLFLLTLCAYFSASYVSNMRALKDISLQLPQAPVLSADIARRVALLSDVAEKIKHFESRVESHAWMLPGKSQNRLALSALKHSYADWVRPGLLTLDEAVVSATLAQLPPQRRRSALVALCDYQAWAHSVLTAVKNGATPPAAKDSVDSFAETLGSLLPAGSAYLSNVFSAYARWETPGSRDIQIDQQSLRLASYLDLLGTDLNWLTEWLNARSSIAPVRLNAFWPRARADPHVPPAYTPQGFKRLESMLQALENAALDKASFAASAADYKRRYANAYRAAWWRMAAAFGACLEDNTQPEQWRVLAGQMAQADNPFFRFIRAMADAFEPVAALGDVAARDTLPAEFTAVLDGYAAQGTPQTLGEKITETRENLQTAVDSGKARETDRRADSVKLYAAYAKALTELRTSTRTDSNALALAAAGYTGGSAAAGTPVSAGLTALAELKARMDEGYSHHSLFWSLVEGPLAFQTILAIYRSACALNSLWDATVLANTAQLPPEALWDQLFGDQSTLRAFVTGPAKPFLRARPDGWSPARWLGVSYPVSPELLRFLDLGINENNKVKEKYAVHITARPVNVNDMAQKPHRVSLRLECGDATQTLDNYNYPVSREFVWQPATCGAVSLEVAFEGVNVTRKWEGEWAFQQFLREAAGGDLLLRPEDFPAQKQALEALDVEEIHVRYGFKGADEVLAAQRYTPVGLPRSAAVCRAGASAALGEDAGLTGVRLPSLAGAPALRGSGTVPPPASAGPQGGRP
ncbi:type VI secretion protein IcmF/TssM N-terminal domain-containing protein [Desulfovibrio sp. ZJ369]|uniref:type VI secretion protein IcmF/TssM N-terminal domain-containing protein n=1 Tax=Desulfovibrio sp. ZJ369 TaxID=2709793 RepID=UPI0013EE2ECD|nr:type VI secretion protein IcmF/TssM N-terminal domain-containing protein [Desulfovibrio sp. ZJ369]